MTEAKSIVWAAAPQPNKFILLYNVSFLQAAQIVYPSSTYRNVHFLARMIALGAVLALENPDFVVALLEAFWTLDSGHLSIKRLGYFPKIRPA